jgi:hypothetical protein
MGQPGPKRKDVPREPNGRPQRPNNRPGVIAALNAMEQKRQEDIMAVARNHPHRRAFASYPKMSDEQSKMVESPLGQFLLRHMQDVDRQGVYYGAGLAYADLRARYVAAWGGEAYTDPPERAGTGEGPSLASNTALGEKITKIMDRLEEEGGPEVKLWINLLVVDQLPVPGADVPKVLNGLWIIATELGKLDGRLNKVA